jgi:hypothetical protein
MSIWQRIGIAISVLWLLGLPIFLFVDSNRSRGKVLEVCLNTGAALREPTDRETLQDICRRAFEGSRETPGKFLKELTSGKVSWAVMLLPIAVLWIVAGAISYVVRGVCRIARGWRISH